MGFFFFFFAGERDGRRRLLTASLSLGETALHRHVSRGDQGRGGSGGLLDGVDSIFFCLFVVVFFCGGAAGGLRRTAKAH